MKESSTRANFQLRFDWKVHRPRQHVVPPSYFILQTRFVFVLTDAYVSDIAAPTTSLYVALLLFCQARAEVYLRVEICAA